MPDTITATTRRGEASPRTTARPGLDGGRDAHAYEGAAADEFPPDFAAFAAARSKGIAAARATSVNTYCYVWRPGDGELVPGI